jgi:hypothetical protein
MRDWFAPGQVWRPRRGRHSPVLIVVNVHRADRLVEVIDAAAADRLTAKRTLIRFSDIRASPPARPRRARRPREASRLGKRRAVAEGPVSARIPQRREPGPRLRVAAVDKLHLAVGGRALCGRVIVDELDAYSDEGGCQFFRVS